MEKLFIVLIAGFIAGYFLRNNPRLDRISIIGIDIFLFLLILAMGYSLGQNETVMQSIASIGLDGILIASAAVAGSILFVLPLHYFREREVK
jgi:uncharacterized membrane protein YbjE (DUF340 family)